MSRATEVGTAIGLDVEGSRARYALSRLRYRAAISAALDRLCVEYDDGNGWLIREPVPYAAGGMSDPFERREVDGRGQEHTEALTSGAGRARRDMAGRVEDPGAAGQRGRPVPVPVRVADHTGRLA